MADNDETVLNILLGLAESGMDRHDIQEVIDGAEEIQVEHSATIANMVTHLVRSGVTKASLDVFVDFAHVRGDEDALRLRCLIKTAFPNLENSLETAIGIQYCVRQGLCNKPVIQAAAVEMLN